MSLVKQDRGTFTMFSLLSIELRLEIWEISLAGPRSIQVTSNEMRSEKNGIPAILHVNSESREAALKILARLFDGTNLVGSEDCHFTYFNPKIDTICLYYPEKGFNFHLGPAYSMRMARASGLKYGIEPIQECDNVTSIEVYRDHLNSFSKLHHVLHFRNLERFTIRYRNRLKASSGGEPYWDFDTPFAFARRMVRELMDEGKIFYGYFQRLFERGKISKIPEIILALTPSDALFIVSVDDVSDLKFEGTQVTMNEHVKDLECIKAYKSYKFTFDRG